MDTLLVFVGCGEAPVFGPATCEVVFETGTGLERIRGVVIGIDQCALAAVCSAGETARICWIVRDAGCDGLVHSGERVNPAVLREIVVVKADPRAEHSVLRRAGSVRKPEARRDSFPAAVGNAIDERNI